MEEIRERVLRRPEEDSEKAEEKVAQKLTRWPEVCLNWQPRLVSVDFIRIQNARSKPLYLLLDWIDIDDDTETSRFPALAFKGEK